MTPSCIRSAVAVKAHVPDTTGVSDNHGGEWQMVGETTAPVRIGSGTLAVGSKVFVRVQPTGDRCPHGDVTCPCQDAGDPCHYEGVHPMDCPHPPIAGMPPAAFHCHVEGCEDRMMRLFSGRADPTPQDLNDALDRENHACALFHLGHDHPLMHPEDPAVANAYMRTVREAYSAGFTTLDLLRGSPSWQCGLRRTISSNMDDTLSGLEPPT